ncbi:SusC/RagA family TonB-linked outer membrane protein [Solitalea sp. MAHUQ-68]|uniref:SusC/RagA family TonB-linked outer membrane protein n=1 Tax=Solitalea agri TaxID=2953739 RepID=A0A9X2JBD5_9SPHI|nr:SusC/RagA family TonB-linked outer membrane protein [Solitalea agri]MCO4291294.1 SusC/RagA family TonB-linked outer membrane protein [Solitalea agri]
MKKYLHILLLLLFMGISATAFSQQRTIKGTVTSADDKQPIPSVTVMIKGTSTATQTDLDGKYSIKAAEGATLVFSYIGYLSREIKLGSGDVVNVTLSLDSRQLGEVVVTALGISKEKKTLGYTATELKGDQVSTVKESNIANALSGKVAGVVVTPSSSGPGSASRIVIRGNRSLSQNSQPLYVVDGVPIDNSDNGNVGVKPGDATQQYDRLDYGNGIGDINPDDIESMSVLKGPNAAALYGSRANNGVIIITTKKGRAGKGVGVTFTSSTTIEDPLVLPEYQNQYGQGALGKAPTDMTALLSTPGSWGAKLDGSQQLYYNGTQKAYSAQPNNVKDYFKTGQTYANTLALESGNENLTFRFSYSNFYSKGMLPNSDLLKNTFNLRGTAKFGKRISVDAKITYFTQDADHRPYMGDNYDNPTLQLLQMPRNVANSDIQTYKNADGTLSSWGSTIQNPYWTQYANTNGDTRRRLTGMISGSYQFTDWFTAQVRFGSDYLNQTINQTFPYYHVLYTKGRVTERTPQTLESNFDALLMFKKNIASNITFNGSLGGNMLHQRFEDVGYIGDSFKVPDLETIGNTATQQVTYNFSEKRVNSVYASAEFGYNNYLFLSVTGRNDWSSSLPSNNRSYFYPSVSASWVFSEMFQLSPSTISFGKLRLSYAKVGSDVIPYQTLSLYSIDPRLYNGSPRSYVPQVKPNENLKPETTNSFEIGAELRFLNNRLYTDFSYYNTKSKDQIVSLPVPQSTGYTQQWANAGELTNKGVEVLVGGIPVKTKDFTWDASLNFAHNENTLNSLLPGFPTYLLGDLDQTPTVKIAATVGGGYGDIYGNTYLKDSQGRLVLDANGIPLSSSSPVILGNYQPKWTAGFTNTLTYKNLAFSFLIDARVGGQLYSYTDQYLTSLGVSLESLEGREGGVPVSGVNEAGNVVNTNVEASSYYNTRNARIAEQYIYSATNVRLREASLQYRVPIKNQFFRSFTVGLVGRNLFFISKKTKNIDPESSYSVSNSQGISFFNMPSSRSFGLNLNVSF